MIPLPKFVAAGNGHVELKNSCSHNTINHSLPPEGYTLDISTDGKVSIAGGSQAGIYYGMQTVRQLLPPPSLRHAAPEGPWTVPIVHISDAPRFKWRGVMLDVARHFMPVSDVRRFINMAAMHKLNVLHLHITDDQGWRFEVPGWPELTTVGAWRKRSMLGTTNHELYDNRPHGGFYTADDLREIVAFAAERHVTIVPEVDMPGHMQAAIAAYPSLGNGKQGERIDVRAAWGISKNVLNMSEKTLGFCKDVLDAICDIFPGEIIGIGGDECPHDEWRTSPEIQALIQKLGIADEKALHGWFVTQMAAHLAQKNPPRRAYGWDEVLAAGDGLPSETLIAAWRGVEPTAIAAKRGFEVISCPDTARYLDYRQSEEPDEPTPVGTLLTVRDVYDYEPVPSELTRAEKAKVIGTQVNVWTEHMETARRVEYMVYPRLCAFAEVAWGKPEGGFENFEERLNEHYARLDALAINYRRPTGPRPWDARPDAPGNPRTREEREAHNKVLLEGLL